ncbi:MAG: NUDIX domain-containing protein [Patescibacteria group bacterium]
MHHAIEEIRIKAMCLFYHEGKILVSRGYDTVKKEHFFRVLGGTVNFFETAEVGVRREIQEELQSGIEQLEFLEVIENLFIYRGGKGHQITFLYTGTLARKALYEQNPIHIVEETYEFDAEWVPVDDVLINKIPLYPTANYRALFAIWKSRS